MPKNTGRIRIVMLFAASAAILLLLFASAYPAIRGSESFDVQSDDINQMGGSGTSESFGMTSSLPDIGGAGSSDSESFSEHSGLLNNLNITPEAPTDLKQFRSDGATIEVGGWINEGTVVLKFNMYDPDSSDVLTPQAEIRPTSEAFSNSPNFTGTDVAFSGSTVEGIVTAEGLSAGTYHWQARVKDSSGFVSGWVSFGGNAEDEMDFGVDISSPEVSIITPTASEVVLGGTTYEVTWIVTEEGGSGLIADPITLYYSTNEGSSWTLIASGEADDGSHIWNVPILNSSDCYISIEAEDNAGNIGQGLSGKFEIMGSGWIKGTVTLSGEVDHSGAIVEAYILGKMFGTAETSYNGSYTIRVLSGTYSVEANKPGFSIGGYNTPVTVTPGATIESISMTLAKGWPQFHQDLKLTGSSPEKKLEPPLSFRWIYDAGENITTSPIMADGKVFFAIKNKMMAVDAKNGSFLWSYPFEVQYTRYMSRSLCYYKGTVYGVKKAAPSVLHAVNASDGAFLWSYALVGSSSGTLTYPVAARGLVYGGTYISSPYPYYWAVNASTGQLVWSYSFGPDTRQVETAGTIVGNNLYTVFLGDHGTKSWLVELDSSTGRLNWSFHTGHIVRAGLSYDKGRLFGVNFDSNTFAVDTSPPPTTFAWSYKMTYDFAHDSYQVPAVLDDNVYVGGANEVFYKHSRDGSLLWSTQLDGLLSSSPALAKGYVYMPSDSGIIYVLDGSDGSVAWSYDTGYPTSSYTLYSPAIADGYMYVNPASSTKLFAFENNITPEVNYPFSQWRADGVTHVATGEWTNSLIIKIYMSDGNGYDILYPEIEFRPTGEAFTGVPNATGGGVEYNGTTVEGITTIEGFESGLYHWQARVRDMSGYVSSWLSFGDNDEGDTDVGLDVAIPDLTVLSPTASEVLYGGTTYEVTWIVTEEGGSGLIADPITLYYSTNEGASWVLIASGEADDGSYVWNVPILNSSDCYISIEAEDEAGNIGQGLSGKFEIMSSGWIKGFVTLTGENNHSGALVEACVHGRMYASAETSSDGSYVIRVLSGTYSVEANKPGYEINGYSTSVNVSSNSTVESINMTLGKAWPMFHQDLHNTGNSPDRKTEPPLTLKWTYTADENILTSPVVGDGKVYVGVSGGKIIAADAFDGALKWSYQTVTYYTKKPIIRNPLCYYKGTVYGSCSQYRVIYALDSDTGSLKFSYELPVYEGAALIDAKLKAARGVLYFGASSPDDPKETKAMALDAYSGSILWSFSDPKEYQGMPCTFTLVDNNLYFSTRGTSWTLAMVYNVDPATGALKWSGHPGYITMNGLSFGNGRLYGTNIGGEIFAMDAWTGEKLWSYVTDSYTDDGSQIPAVSGEAIYVGSANGNFYSFSLDGSLLWSSNVGHPLQCSPAIANGHVYFVAGDGNIYSATTSDGSIAWSYYLGNIPAGEKKSPAVSDGYLYITTTSPVIYAFENNAAPETPADLGQFRSDTITSIPTGEWTNEDTVVFKFTMDDDNDIDTLYPEVEVRLTSEAFTGVPTATGEGVARSGSSVTGVVTVEGLASGDYHWQARVRDPVGAVSSWEAFGGNLETEPDFRVDIDAPDTPASLEAIALPPESPSYVTLSWEEVSDQDGSGFKGYNLYRSSTHGSGYSVLMEGITGTSTTDSSVVYGNNYYYVITAVDMAENESEFSNESSAPNLNMTRYLTSEAPVAGGYSGGAFDPVPGAALIYSISFWNDGFAPAASVEVVDKIPDHTEYKLDSATGEAVDDVRFSSDGGASFDYTPSGTYVDPSVTHIKWFCPDISVTDVSTVEFKAVIK